MCYAVCYITLHVSKNTRLLASFTGSLGDRVGKLNEDSIYIVQ